MPLIGDGHRDGQVGFRHRENPPLCLLLVLPPNVVRAAWPGRLPSVQRSWCPRRFRSRFPPVLAARAHRRIRCPVWRANVVWPSFTGTAAVDGGSRPCLVRSPNQHLPAERLLRQAKPWRGGCHELKPLVAIQRVRLPPGKGAARQPEASLAWRAVTPVVKRRQQVMKRRRKPRNRESDDAFIVNRVGAAPEAPP